jgi:hypothetical protein
LCGGLAITQIFAAGERHGVFERLVQIHRCHQPSEAAEQRTNRCLLSVYTAARGSKLAR